MLWGFCIYGPRTHNLCVVQSNERTPCVDFKVCCRGPRFCRVATRCDAGFGKFLSK